MGDVTANTIWPTSTSIPASTRSLIELFFNLADLNAPEAGPRMADEVFAEDGEFVSAVNSTKGSAAIARSRDDAWTAVKARKHAISKVYAHDAAGQDLLLIGTLRATVNNGNVAEVNFVGQVVLTETGKGTRFKSYQVWGDMSPVARAMK